jgi:hypothetical protein
MVPQLSIHRRITSACRVTEGVSGPDLPRAWLGLFPDSCPPRSSIAVYQLGVCHYVKDKLEMSARSPGGDLGEPSRCVLAHVCHKRGS